MISELSDFRICVRRDGSGNGNRSHQPLGVGMLRIAEDRHRRPDLDDLTEIHHRHAVADALDHRHVVRNEQVGETELCCRSSIRLTTCALIDTSSAETAFVGDDDLGLERQRAGDTDALPLAAGELMRIAVRHIRVQADALQQVHRPLSRAWSRRAKLVQSDRARQSPRRRVMRGLRLANGSWKIIWICRRMSRIASLSSAEDVGAVEPDLAALRVDSRMMARPVVDLPQPDSPTSDSVSPGMMSKETFSTACTRPRTSPEQPRWNVEALDQVAHLKHRSGCRADGIGRVRGHASSVPVCLSISGKCCGWPLARRLRAGARPRSGLLV